MIDSVEEMDELVLRFRNLGFRVRENAHFFAPSGIGVGKGSRYVFVYPSHRCWEIRVTQHGGPHWARRAQDVDEVVRIVRDYLANPIKPPGEGWGEEW